MTHRRVLHTPVCRMVAKHSLLDVINAPEFDATSVELVVFSLLRLLRQPFCSSLSPHSHADSPECTDLPFDDVIASQCGDE